ncbi:MAG: hypothetical protein AB8B82_03520 [Roseovarius sp.]
MALLSRAVMLSSFRSDDDVILPVEPEIPGEPEYPDKLLDIGATVEQTEDGVSTEDETLR